MTSYNNNSNNTIKAAIIGAAGYTGFELLKILKKHAFVKVIIATSNTYSNKLIADVFPSISSLENKTVLNSSTDEFNNDNCIDGYDCRKFVSADSLGSHILNADVVFLCLPPHESMEFVNKHLKKYSGSIIDIGSDFRLQEFNDYKYWYGKEHQAKRMLKDFVYGLPEVNYSRIKNAKHIANPGCYPTSVLLALAPLLKNRDNNRKKHKDQEGEERDSEYRSKTSLVFDIIDINIDSKSGVSGAGRKLKEMYLFFSMNENFYAYSTLMHRHIGEIEQELKNLSGRDIKVCFTPHLLPVDRGIFTSIYCKIKTSKNPDEIKKSVCLNFEKYYSGSCFVKFLGERVPQIKDVAHTNFCHIGFSYDERTGTLKIFSAIDNLIKGAAGQAVQNMNIIFNFNQWEGLDG